MRGRVLYSSNSEETQLQSSFLIQEKSDQEEEQRKNGDSKKPLKPKWKGRKVWERY
jgi:hypothetical protein